MHKEYEAYNVHNSFQAANILKRMKIPKKQQFYNYIHKVNSILFYTITTHKVLIIHLLFLLNYT